MKDYGKGRISVALGGQTKCHKNLLGKPEETKPLSRPRRRSDCDIKINLKRIIWNGVKMIHLAQNGDKRRILVYTVMKSWFHKIYEGRTESHEQQFFVK